MEYEIADILRDHIREIEATNHQYKVLNHIIDCRTMFMGGHLLECNNPKCEHTENLYNSCCDRHCPKCQGSKQIEWKVKKNNDILPVMYSHVTSTIPRFLYSIVRYNEKECYSLMFKSLNEALVELSLGSKIGFISIIHTWTQLVDYHPHIHCLLPEVKINKYNKCKISSQNNLFNRKSYFRPAEQNKTGYHKKNMFRRISSGHLFTI